MREREQKSIKLGFPNGRVRGTSYLGVLIMKVGFHSPPRGQSFSFNPLSVDGTPKSSE